MNRWPGLVPQSFVVGSLFATTAPPTNALTEKSRYMLRIYMQANWYHSHLGFETHARYVNPTEKKNLYSGEAQHTHEWKEREREKEGWGEP